MSLNLDDLEDFRDIGGGSGGRVGSGAGGIYALSNRDDDGNDGGAGEGFSLASWHHEQEATTGNIGFLRYASLDSVIEDSDVEDSDDDNTAGPGGLSDPEIRRGWYKNEESISTHCHNQQEEDHLQERHHQQQQPQSDEVDRVGELAFSGSNFFLPSSSPAKGCFPNEGSSQLGERRVHFEVPARLEDIQEYDGPDKEDYSQLYYMAHEIQKMMDDFRAEERLDRQVLR
jgi:hypothetical protein